MVNVKVSMWGVIKTAVLCTVLVNTIATITNTVTKLASSSITIDASTGRSSKR